MKKIILIFFFVLIFIFNDTYAETITIYPGETRTISFSQELETISFSKNTDFFVKTLNGGVWSDVGNTPSEYTPLKGYIINNSTGALLSIDYTNKSNIGASDTLLQRTLTAGWNLIGIASDNTRETIVNGLGNGFNYSRVVDFSNTNFSINNAGTLIGNNFNLNNYGDSGYMHEGTAYAVFISNDQILSGVQNITDVNGYYGQDTIKLTIAAIDSLKNKIRQNKSNVVFGQLKIVNAAGKNLVLQNLGVLFTSNNSGILELVENVEFEVNGISYELPTSNTSLTATTVTYSDTDLNVILPQGTTILTFRADTLVNLLDNETIKLTLDGTTPNFRIEETTNAVTVTDISPSALSWNKVTVINSTATLSNVPLADVEVVKGATDLVALQFEIEAGSASYVSTDRIKVKLFNNSGSTVITKNEVSEIALYRGSVSLSNLLDRVSGSKLDSNGIATFDGFDVEIAADATETFLVTVSTVDTDDIIGAKIVASVANTDIDVEDDENDTVTLNTLTVTDKVITVKGSGILVLTADANNVDNEDSKTILAGQEIVVYSTDTKATNEEVNAETVTFTLNKNLKTIIASAKLYLNDTVVATATNSDVSDATGSVITFDNITNLDFPTTTAELKLAIVTENIGYEKIGSAIAGVTVDNVAITDAEGVDSAEIVNVNALSVTSSNTFDVVPTTIVASASDLFVRTDNLAQITFAVDTGSNTIASGNTLTATLSGVTLEVSSILANGTGTITLTNSTNDIIASGTVLANGTITLSVVANEVINNGEVYTLETTAEATFKLTKDGVEYSVDGAVYNMSLKANENLGSYNDGTN